MSNQLDIQIADGVLGHSRRQQIDAFLRRPAWEFGWKSDAKKDAFSFWHKHFAGNLKPDNYNHDGSGHQYECSDELKSCAPILYDVWMDLKESIFTDHDLVRCYANGAPFGSEGSLHTDSVSPESYTAIYYPHENWHPNWGGETLFFNQSEDDVVGTVFPRPDRLVFFKGRIPHVARGVSRTCPLLRVTLMFKTELRRSRSTNRSITTTDPILSFLISEVQPQEIAHSGRSLLTHLLGTCALLRQWGNEEYICLAGLFHSIYGTRHFNTVACPVSERKRIQQVIGTEAEQLVYVFCVTKRPESFLASYEESSGESHVLKDENTGDDIVVTTRQIMCLLEIEAANLLEQGGGPKHILRRIMGCPISDAASRAVQSYLGAS